jgi:hypothetical protein
MVSFNQFLDSLVYCPNCDRAHEPDILFESGSPGTCANCCADIEQLRTARCESCMEIPSSKGLCGCDYEMMYGLTI